MRQLPAFVLAACLLAGPVHAAGVAFKQIDKYAAGANLYALQAADLDGDGDLDLVSASVGANAVSVRLNDGSGKFVAGAVYASAGPITIALADFDQDGKVDMAVGEVFGDYVILRRGLGDGTFGPSFEAPFTGGVRDLEFADLDGDGFLDLAAVRGDRVFLFRGDGAGGFADPLPVVVGGLLKAISVGDLDGDGRPDLAAVDYNGKRVVPIRNVGSFAFTTLAPLAAATGASDVALADFDGDGDLEVAITNENSTAMVYQNSGPAIFGGRTSYPIGALAQTMATADLDLDGNKDLVVSSFTANSVYVFPGTKNGYFGSPFAAVLSSGGPRCVAVADFDGNGVPDLAVGDDVGNVRVLANQAGPALVLALQPLALSVPGNGGSRMIATDLNGDGDKDLVISQWGAQRLAILSNDGHGGFTGPTFLNTQLPAAVVTGDFNHDGKRDLVAANDINGGGMTLFAGLGNGVFAPGVTVSAFFSLDDAAVLDMNGDGYDDVVAVSLQVILWRQGGPSGLGAGSFFQNVGPAAFTSIVTGDFTGDGRPDIAVVSPDVDYVRIFRNNSGTSFVFFADLPTHHAPAVAVARDVDGDGRVDLVVGGATAVDVFRNMGGGSWARKGSVDLGGRAARSLDLADFDGNGVLDVLVATSPDDAIQVLLSAPDLSLTASTVSSGALAVNSVVAADLTGDGLADGAAAFGGGLLLLTNAHTSNFPAPPAQPAACAGIPIGLPDRPTQALVGDFDNDGNRDLAAVTEGGWGSFMRGLPGSPSGPRFDFEVPLGAQSIAALDLDGDGASELAITDTEGHALRLYRRSGTEFTAFADVEVGTHPRFVIAADLDRDGRLDLATVDDSGDAANGAVTILFNKAGLSWAPVAEPIVGQSPFDDTPVASGPGGPPTESNDLRVDLPVGIGPTFLAAADLDQDGELDLVVNERGGTLSILHALGGGRFHPAQSFAVAGTSTTIADLDGDGRLDLAVVDTEHDAIHVLYNTAIDPWTTGRIVPTEDEPVAVGAIDLNTDGVPDLAYVTGDGGIFSTRLGTALHEFRNGFACRSGVDSRGVTLVPRGDGGVDAYVLSRGEDRVTMTSFAPVFFGRQAETQGDRAALLATPFNLESPHPNPAAGRTTIAFGLPARAPVRVGVYDVRGRLVRTLADGPFDAGRHELGWDGSDEGGARVATGVYWYRLVSPAGTRVERQVIVGP